MNRYIDPVPQYFLNNGDLASDGYLYFFENLDYLTPKSTFNSIGVENTHPIPLDGSGRIPDIFGSGLYSIEFRSSDGVLQWQRDNVEIEPSLAGLGNTIVGDLTFSEDNSSIKSNSVDVIEFTAGSGTPKLPIGIRFPNSNVTGSDVLDWYEEGTLNPSVIGSSGAGTATYNSIRNGNYTRSGNRIDGEINVGWTAHTGGGDLVITGLPFVPSKYGTISILYNGLLVGSGKQLCGYISSGLTYIKLYACDPSGGALSNISLDTAVAQITIYFSYEV